MSYERNIFYLIQLNNNETCKRAKSVNADTAVFQQRSPSCGSKQIYDGTFSRKLIKGKGVTAKLFEEKGVNVLTIENL